MYAMYATSRKTNESNLKKMAKKTSFRPNFSPFSTNLSPPKIFCEFYIYYMLNIVATYHCMQFQGKLMNQTWKNDKTT